MPGKASRTRRRRARSFAIVRASCSGDYALNETHNASPSARRTRKHPSGQSRLVSDPSCGKDEGKTLGHEMNMHASNAT